MFTSGKILALLEEGKSCQILGTTRDVNFWNYWCLKFYVFTQVGEFLLAAVGQVGTAESFRG